MEQDLEQRNEDNIISSAFSTVDGFAVLEILEKYFYNRPDYNQLEPQPYHTFFRAGQRDVIGWIKECMDRANNPVEEQTVKTNL